MDLLFQSPSSVIMGSDFVQVPELNTGKPEENSNLLNGIQEDCLSPVTSNLPRPPPLIPAPTPIEEVPFMSLTLTISASPLPLTPPLSPQKQQEECRLDLQVQVPSRETDSLTPVTSVEVEMGAPPAPSNPTVTATTGLQIMTRKRSSMSAASGTGNTVMPSYGTTSTITSTSAAATSLPATPLLEPPAILSSEIPAGAQAAQQPPKKKKKYTPKPKKCTASTDGGSGAPPKQTKPKSKKKAPTAVVNTQVPVVDANGNAIQNPVVVVPANPAKPKKSCKPKAPKKTPTPGVNGSKSKSSSKKGKQVQSVVVSSLSGVNEILDSSGNVPEGASGVQRAEGGPSLVPPLKIHMPKLTKMISSASGHGLTPIVPMKKIKIKNEPQDWDENGDPINPLMLAETEMMEQDCSDDSGNGKGALSRKKKSKGRNGNIYIGVFNRIEWMSLQHEFGFGSVNNFGTFVLQTMRRVHGDIQFWCDVAVASGVYPELDRYEWTNGFPHAVNKDGQCFTPEPDVTMSDEKRAEVIEMAKGMWDQRLQLLKQQQQQLTGEDDADEVLLDAAVVEDAEDDDEEDDDVAMPRLENYLENMASGQYSEGATVVSKVGEDGRVQTFNSGTVAMTEEEVNKIWNEQMNDSDSLEKFGKLFNFINSIAAIGKMPSVVEQGANDGVTTEEEVGTLGVDANN